MFRNLSAFCRNRILSAAAVSACAVFSSMACGQQYSYTDIETAAANTNAAATTSRGLSINSSGTVLGYYQTATGTASRVYFTLAKGASTVAPLASSLVESAATPTGGSAVGAMLNDTGNYVGAPSTTTTGGYYNGSQFVQPAALPTTYNGTFTYTVTNNTNTYSQMQTATQYVPYTINKNNVSVGSLNFTTAANAALPTSKLNSSPLYHGMIFNPVTGATIDIGGNPSNQAFTNQSAATAESSLSGISDTGIAVGGQSSTTATTTTLTPLDAIYGAPDSSGNYMNFEDLQSKIVTALGLSAPGSTTGNVYYASNASAISKNGRYVVGTYQYSIGAGTTKYTHSFELTDDSVVADLGNLGTNVNTFSNVLDATAVNDSGTVVGYGYLNSSTIHAFVIAAGSSSPIDLTTVAPTPDSGYYSNAYGIDNAGDITGVTSANTGFLLTSVPEPTSLALFGMASSVLVARRGRRSNPVLV